MTHIFISYSKKNKPYTDRLVAYLEQAGFNVWYDGRIDYGTSWQRVIFEAIKNCAAFIVIMTPESYDSDWVEREYLYADKLKKPQFPILLDGEEFPFYVSNQFTDVRGATLPPENFLKRLEQYVQRQNQQGKNVAPTEIKETLIPVAPKVMKISEIEDESVVRQLEEHIKQKNQQGKNVAPPEVKEEKPPAKSEKIVKGPYLLHAHKMTPEKEALIDRLLDFNTTPPERLQIGMRLAELGDPRVGVGLDENGLPEFDWVKIPPGNFFYQNDDIIFMGKFHISKYLITNVQFQAFIHAIDGYTNESLWLGMAESQENPGNQKWKDVNRPRENVNWYEATAFCRWLSYKLTGQLPSLNRVFDWPVRLPTEQEWERVAQGIEGNNYPWGSQYISGYSNIDETDRFMHMKKSGFYFLNQTTSVGVYPQGASSQGILDMSGNVREWCLNEFDNSPDIALFGDYRRVNRGGSWSDPADDARCLYRDWGSPNVYSATVGFRVVLGNYIFI